MAKDERFKLEKEDYEEDKELRKYVISSIAQSVVNNIRPGDAAANRPRNEDQKVPTEQVGRQSGTQEWINARGENGQRYQPPRDPSQRGH